MRLPALILLAGLLAPAAACVGQLEPIGATDDDTGGGPDGGGVGSAAGRQFFTANIEPMVSLARPKGACVGCHQGTDTVNGPDFLGPSTTTHYDTLVVDGGLMGTSPATSLFCNKGDHTGNALCTGAGTPYAECTTDEVTKCGEWVMIEAAR
ncbi:MAG TPA: hypothetical protein VL172_12185 [Kofleriaceae bacterium]|nr:hypothetical protein [Kofleriaceae bacterium]